MKNDLLYLSNIQECIAAIESYTCGGKEAFMQTRMIQDAVIRNLRCDPADVSSAKERAPRQKLLEKLQKDYLHKLKKNIQKYLGEE